MDLESLPYVLCPDIPNQDIRVTPYWFRPKGGGAECPVVHLENVPIGFHNVLDANGFVQRPEGWFVDANDKTERWWRAIFGPIEFVQRKPVKIYEPERVVFAPAPGPVKVILTQYTDEHVERLTKGEGVFGRDAQRAAKNDAVRGAVNCRGAWPIIKAACMDRLERNPEDVATFEYVWGTAKTHGLNTQGLPDKISHTLLLEKVVDRRRLTAQMERVIPISYRSAGAVGSLAWADWTNRCGYIGASHGGPIDIREFSDVDGLAQYLIDGHYEPLEDPEAQVQWAERVSSCLETDDSGGDWTADLEDMVLPEQENPPPSAKEPFSSEEPVDQGMSAIHTQQTARALSWRDVVERVQRLAEETEKRVPYARVISRHLLDTVLSQRDIPLSHPAYLSNLEALIRHFAGVLNRESLEKHMNRHQEELLDLCHALANPQQGRYQLKRLLSGPTAAHTFANAQLEAGGDESNGWWWTGFTCGQIPGTDNWQLFRVNDKSACVPVGTGLYRSAAEVDAALYRQARAARVSVVRVALKEERCFHGYATTTGHIIRLSDDFQSEAEAKNALGSAMPGYLTTYREPILWERTPEPWNSVVASSLLENVVTTLEWPAGLSNLFGELDLSDNGEDVVLTLDGCIRTKVFPGTLLIAWARAFHAWAGRDQDEAFTEVVLPLYGQRLFAQLDISLEDDLLDELADHQREVEARLGTVALSILRQAVSNPSAEAEQQITAFIQEAEEQASEPLLRVLRSILLASAQHQPYQKLTRGHREAFRLGVNAKQYPFAYALIRYCWFRLYWAGGFDPRILGVGAPGDDISGELAPDGAELWSFAIRLETFVASEISAYEKGMGRSISISR